MLNRSMATFMNALTGDDLTLYPFATQNKQDYFNLMDVYLDAVLFPLLKETDFRQEGWRLAPKDDSDPNSELIFKGVVYNEMKGVFADSNNVFVQRHQEELFKGSSYDSVSGGCPTKITNLTVDDLRNYQKSHYHPSNATIVTFGSFDLQEILAKVEEKISGFEPISSETIPEIARWDRPRTVSLKGPFDPSGPEDQTKVAVSFMLGDSTSLVDSYATSILSNLLIDGSGSPMHKALVQSRLGSEFAPTTGFSNNQPLTSLSFGLQRVAQNNSRKVSETVMQVLEDSYKTGFTKQQIRAAFHQMELGLAHRTTSFGMHMGWNAIRHKVHGGDPLEAFDIFKHVASAKELVSKPGYLESLIKNELLDNSHRLDFEMVPDPSYGESVAEEEKARLESHVSKLSPDDVVRVVQEAKELAHVQSLPQGIINFKPLDASCLPSLRTSDVSREPQNYAISHFKTKSGIELSVRETTTNDISYITLKYECSHVPHEYFKYLPLFCSSLTSLGTKSIKLTEFDEQIRLYTGGIYASCSSITSKNDISKQTSFITIGTSCKNENLEKAYELIQKVVFEVDFDSLSDLETTLTASRTALSNSIVQSGHSYATSLAASSFSPSSQIGEIFSGISQVEFLNEISKVGDIESISEKFKEISKVFVENLPKMLVITEKQAEARHMELVDSLFIPASLNASNDSALTYKVQDMPLKNHEMPNLGINFTGRCYKGVPYNHQDSPSLKLLASLMTWKFLHKELREKNGAYGGGMKYNALGGILSLYTYRDPPPHTRTFDLYSSLGPLIESGFIRSLSTQDLEEAKLDVLKELDGPLNASQEGKGEFLSGVTFDDRKAFRERLLDADLESVDRVAKQYLVAGAFKSAFVGQGHAA